MLDELEIGVENATAIVAAGIDFEAYTDPMPESNKDMIEAAHEVVGMGLSSWLEDEVRGGKDADEEEKEAAEQIKLIFSLAGIKAKGDKITYGKAPGLDRINEILEEGDIPDPENDDSLFQVTAGDGDDNDGDGAAFDIDEIIDGYSDLSAATKVKKIKARELDADDEDDLATITAIREWENAQDEPSSRVLSYLDETFGAAGEDDGADGDGDTNPYTKKELLALDKDELKKIWTDWEMDADEFPRRFTDAGKKRVVDALLAAQEDNGDDNDGDGAADDAAPEEEPWDGYNELEEDAIKEALEGQLEDDESPLEVEQVDYVIAYEGGFDEPNEDLIKWLKKLKTKVEKAASKKEEEKEEEKPKRGRSRAKKEEKAEPADDKKDAAGLTLTREMILEALSEGEVVIS